MIVVGVVTPLFSTGVVKVYFQPLNTGSMISGFRSTFVGPEYEPTEIIRVVRASAELMLPSQLTSAATVSISSRVPTEYLRIFRASAEFAVLSPFTSPRTLAEAEIAKTETASMAEIKIESIFFRSPARPG